MQDSLKYDYIIIGAGLGGLASGAMLAKQGSKVLVLEKHNIVGGYATNFKRGDFTFDVSLHVTGGIKNNFAYTRALKKAGVYDRLEFIRTKEVYRSIFPDLDITLPNKGINEIKKALFEKFPLQKWQINLFFYFIKKHQREYKLWDKTKLILPIAPLLMPVLLLGMKVSLSTFLWFIKDKKLKAVLTQLWPYFGLPPKRLAAQYFFAGTNGYFFDGSYYIKGGSQMLSNAFRNVIEENGGNIKTSEAAVEIIFKNNQVSGVKTSKNITYYSGRIISNVNPFTVYSDLLKKWSKSQSEIEKFSKKEVSLSAFNLYLGLDCPIEKIAPQFKDTYEVFFNEIYDFDTYYQKVEETKNAQAFADSLNACIYSNIDNSFAKNNKAVLSVISMATMEQWDFKDKKQYKKMKEQVAQEILSKIEKYIPTIKDHIEVIEIGTPKTFKRYTGNPKGAFYGFSQNTSQCGPIGRLKQKSSLKGLYFSSAWSFPGGGFEGTITGAYEMVKNLKK